MMTNKERELLTELENELTGLIANANLYLSAHLQFKFGVSKLDQLLPSQYMETIELLKALIRYVNREYYGKQDVSRPARME